MSVLGHWQQRARQEESWGKSGVPLPPGKMAKDEQLRVQQMLCLRILDESRVTLPTQGGARQVTGKKPGGQLTVSKDGGSGMSSWSPPPEPASSIGQGLLSSLRAVTFLKEELLSSPQGSDISKARTAFLPSGQRHF